MLLSFYHEWPALSRKQIFTRQKHQAFRYSNGLIWSISSIPCSSLAWRKVPKKCIVYWNNETSSSQKFNSMGFSALGPISQYLVVNLVRTTSVTNMTGYSAFPVRKLIHLFRRNNLILSCYMLLCTCSRNSRTEGLFCCSKTSSTTLLHFYK